MFLYVDLDAFFASAERALRPSLREKPVIVGRNPGGRGVVLCASYEARAFGIHSGMPVERAKRLCPHGIFLDGHPDLYRGFSSRLFRILGEATPDVEPLSCEEAILNLAGCGRIHPSPMAAAETIRRRVVGETGIPLSVGIAGKKGVARIACALAKPNGILWVFPQSEERFLSRLPVFRLPGVGAAMERQLELLGIRTVGQLGKVPLPLLRATLGRRGDALGFLARGEPTPLPRGGRRCSLSAQTTLEEDTSDRARLASLLFRLAQTVGFRLRKRAWKAKRVTLHIRYSDLRECSRTSTLGSGTNMDGRIGAAARRLLEKALSRRVRVRRLGLRVVAVPEESGQLRLFSPRENRLRAFYGAADRIRERWGWGAVTSARTLPAESEKNFNKESRRPGMRNFGKANEGLRDELSKDSPLLDSWLP